MRENRRHLIVLSAIAAVLGGALSATALGQPRLVYVTGSTQKVSQLTGDFDRMLGQPTLNQTDKRFGVFATDLGSSFEHNGKLFFLFGDTWGKPGLLDAVAWSESYDPAKIALDFHRAPDGKWLPPEVPGIRLREFEIPSGGISVGGKMYVVFTTDWTPEKHLMGRSVLAVSQDNGKRFKVLYDLSKSKFINVSIWSSGGWLYVFGSGAYRKSSVYLARIKAGKISERSQMQYFGGVNSKKKPQWSVREQDATPLFQHDVVGEFSVAYCKPVRRYVMLYNSHSPRGIVMRSSATPWGPWSEGTVVFDPWRDKGYGYFMHIQTGFKSDRSDTVNDPGRESEWGGEYGPYILARFTTGSAKRCRLFYTMSTWNPYQVVVMQTDLKLE